MPNYTQMIPEGTSLSKYSREMLNVYNNRIAEDRLDALLYMMVGADRLRLVHELTEKMHDQLAIGSRRSSEGIYFCGVTGGFGAGKSHIGYLLKNDALTCDDELLVAHVQITAESRFPQMLDKILRAFRLSGKPSEVVFEVELSAYRQLLEWAGGEQEALFEVVNRAAGDIHQAVIDDFVGAIMAATNQKSPDISPLQQFFSAWVGKSTPREALGVFEMILRVFKEFKVDRFLLVIDEFEAISGQEETEQKETLQFVQAMHDDLAKGNRMPATFMVALATGDFWSHAAIDLLPSLMDQNNRCRDVYQIPALQRVDVAALIYRYLGLYQLAEGNVNALNSQDLEQLTETAWTQISAQAWHVRSAHTRVRNLLKARLGL